MAADASRSPSPVAAPPIEATPGPRAAKLLKLYEEAIVHTVGTCNYDNFAACFPTTAENVPDALKDFHQGLIDHLNSAFRRSFEATLFQRGVVQSLNDLDRLVDEARKRKAKAEAEANAKGGPVALPTPPHTLSAQSLYLAHLGPSLTPKHQELTDRLARAQSENIALAEVLGRQRREMNNIVAGVEAVVADLDKCLEAMPSDQMQALTKDTVELDVEMRAGG